MTTQRTASMTAASTVTTGRRGAARRAWRKIGATIHEMNYAAVRVAMPRIPGQPTGTGA
jgi:hypothetical protein